MLAFVDSGLVHRMDLDCWGRGRILPRADPVLGPGQLSSVRKRYVVNIFSFHHAVLNSMCLSASWSVSIFVFATIVIFAMPNKVFAWFEYFTSLVKIFVFLLIIVLSLALVLGAGPNGFVHHGDTWTRLPPFLNGFTVSWAAPPPPFPPRTKEEETKTSSTRACGRNQGKHS